jgi:hypothetical protein
MLGGRSREVVEQKCPLGRDKPSAELIALGQNRAGRSSGSMRRTGRLWQGAGAQNPKKKSGKRYMRTHIAYIMRLQVKLLFACGAVHAGIVAFTRVHTQLMTGLFCVDID